MADDPNKDEVTEKAAETEVPEAAQSEPTAPAKEVEELERKDAEATEPKDADATEAKGDEAEAEAKPKKPRAKKPAAEKADTRSSASPATGTGAKPKTPAKAAKAETKEKAKAPADKPAPQRRNGRAAEPAVLVRAQARYVRSSARKARLVCDAIRGKDVAQARAILAFHPRAVAEAWEKLLESAIANAENNHDLDGDDLKVHAVFADEGPTIKRFRPRAMGRATRIRKRTSHLTIQLAPKETR